MPRKAEKKEHGPEHIFPASQLTPLAMKWKELTDTHRQREAMEILEEIVVKSSAMFQRLAMFEDFHYTVDLDILVSAAQERVVKWLLVGTRKRVASSPGFRSARKMPSAANW
jgi:hypothetical protein